MIIQSSIEPLFYLLPIIGFAIGLFGSVLGGGGGFFFLPLLTLVYDVPAQTAVITSLVATLPICVVASIGHSRKGHIDLRTAWVFAMAGIIGAFAGAGITSIISERQLKVAFGLYSVIIALHMALKISRDKEDKATSSGWVNRAKGLFYGFFAGGITGSFGTSGTAPVLVGLFSLQLPIKLVIGTSMLIVMVNTLFAIGAHALVGSINITLVGFLTSGSVIGALIGPRFLSKTKTDNKENGFKYIYALVMIIIGLLMILN